MTLAARFPVKGRSAALCAIMREIDRAGDRRMVSPVSEATDRCRSCGNDLRAKARFCDVCGSPVSPTSATGEHKQVTVLFADVVGSMKLAAALDGERLQEIMNELFNRAAAVVQRYQGTVDKFTGDGLMALFGAPVALEDHASAFQRWRSKPSLRSSRPRCFAVTTFPCRYVSG
jgi:class 3 adenylate cyclase